MSPTNRQGGSSFLKNRCHQGGNMKRWSHSVRTVLAMLIVVDTFLALTPVALARAKSARFACFAPSTF
jgi:hypothetical protein